MSEKRLCRARAAARAALLVCLAAATTASGAERVFNVRDFGAAADGTRLCTQAIQQAIDACAEQGGGAVVLPAGRWLSGTIYLESNIVLELQAGCTLVGSRNRDDYGQPRKPRSGGPEAETHRLRALIAGANLANISIRGPGGLDGSGEAFRWKEDGRPRGVYLENCRNVLVENVAMRNAGSWMQHYRKCEGVVLRGVSVFNHATYNNDGMNIDSCRDVRISDCRIDSDDDALVLKSLSLQPCENIVITNCILSSHCNSLKMGTESGGGFRNIAVANCAIESPQQSQSIYGRQRGLAGVALEIVDGGELDRIAISNLAIRGVSVPIFMRLGNRARQYGPDAAKPAVGAFRNVLVSDVVATDCSPIGCSITGLPGHPIENVSLANIRLEFEGGGAGELALQEVPEKPDSYPESTMFGTLPAYGLFVRHARNIALRNLQLRFQQEDRRPPLLCDDVRDLEVVGFDADTVESAGQSLIWLKDVRGAWIHGCRPTSKARAFLRVDGRTSAGIRLLGNDLANAGKTAELGGDVPSEAVYAADNAQRPQ